MERTATASTLTRALSLAFALAATGCPGPEETRVDHLAVISVGPSPGATGIGVDTDVRVTFSEVLRAESVNQGSICITLATATEASQCTEAVPSQVTYDAADLAITVLPQLTLTTSTEYAILITEDIRGESGTLPSPVRTTFTTATP
jgi:hypothetical protein